MSSVAKVKGIERLSPAELGELAAAAAAIGIPVDWLAAVISFETAGTFSPSVKNAAGSGATGLIQFMPTTAQNLLGSATKEEAIRQTAAMGFGEQLRRMVVPYFRPYAARLKSLNDVYLAVFYPAFISKADGDVVASEGSAVYRQNAGFDTSRKGWITKADITSTIRKVLNAADGRVPIGAAAAAGGGAALLAIGVGAFFLLKSRRRRAA